MSRMRPENSVDPMVSGFMAAHREPVLTLASRRVRKQRPARPELEELRDKNLSMLFESILSEVRALEAEGPDSAPRVAGGAHSSGEQLAFDIGELVFQYESLCHSVNEVARRVGTVIPPADQQSLNTALDDCIARTMIEWEHERRKSRGTNETQRLGFVAHELR